jgi:diguanylate cyclase (GGDEF)-like protein
VQILRNFTAPIGMLAVALFLSEHLVLLPGLLAVLKAYGPPLALAVGALLSISFKRGRALFAIVSLAAAYFAFPSVVDDPGSFASRTIWGAVCVLVPANIAIYSIVRERGALNAFGVRRLALISFECLVVLNIILDSRHAVTDALYLRLFPGAIFADPRVPDLAILVVACALVVTAANSIVKKSMIDAAFAGSIVAFAAACQATSAPEAFAIYIAAAAGTITVGVLQDSYRMAFRDELTGLPGRRALNERLMSLVGHYAIAMVDVDYFKSFNDKWGHDVGDQVLKLVASRLQHPGRGGEAYRYGGEEFTILFPGKRLSEVFPRLDALRHDIETYRFLMREGDRTEKDDAKPHSGAPSAAGRTLVSVTVSIGVAEKVERASRSDDVLRAADAALYRAKAEGRNRVCR